MPVSQGSAPSSRRSLIVFDGVTKRYDDVVAVDNLSLTIGEGEFFALLGPSGCGKTTLMRILAGFEGVSAGDVKLGGESILTVPAHRRPVNMMFQSYALFPHLSVWNNIAYGLRREGLAKADVRARVDEMLALTQLSAQARRKPHQLSGGQRQRVALARSLAKKPRVLLLDEPLAALDKKLRGDTQFELMNIQEELGITFLIVTHDQEEAMVLADRIAIMRDGRIEQVATPQEVYESPASRYVADFVGDVNLIDVTVTEAAPDALHLAARSGPGRFTLPPREGVRAGDQGTVAVRPEKMRMRLDEDGAEAANTLHGTVFDIAYMGDYSLFRVRRTDGAVIEASRFNTRRVEEEPVTWDDRVRVFFAPEDAIFLER